MDEISFQAFLNEKLRERGLSIKKLSELTGIAVKHLENLSTGRLEDLPAIPYLRGYLIEIGEVLGFDGETWLDRFKKEGVLKGSGAHDELPRNRFAQKPINKTIFVGAIVLIILLYIGIRSSQIFGKPIIEIISPAQETATVAEDQFLITGDVRGADQLSINGEQITIDTSGHWQKTVLLQPGLNSVSIIAKKFLGRETEVVRRIIYEPPAEDPLDPRNVVPSSSTRQFEN